MKPISRRTILAHCSLAASAIAAQAFLPGFAAAAERLIKPPLGEMQFSWRLTRPLQGGIAIVVERRSKVVFSQFAYGFLVEGQLLEVIVDFPPQLERFADLERQRQNDGLFPLVLNPFGVLQPEAIPQSDDKTVKEAAGVASNMIENSDIPAADREELSGLVTSVGQAGQAFSIELPQNLFSPPLTKQVDIHSFQLADGSWGEVETAFSGESDMTTGLMKMATRTVTTRIGDDERATREDWTLQPGD